MQIPLAVNNNAAGTSQELKFMAYARGLLTTTPPTTAGGFAPCTPSRELRPLPPFHRLADEAGGRRNTFSLYRKSLSFVTLRVKAEPLREIGNIRFDLTLRTAESRLPSLMI